jgi:ribosome modulation factor
MPQNRFFFDRVQPMIECDDGALRVVTPDDSYPGDPTEWRDGYRAYVNGYPASHMPDEEFPEECRQSWIHGYLTARVAEQLGATPPQHMEHYGAPSLLHAVQQAEEPSRPKASTENSLPSPKELCPFEDDGKRTAWIEGYRGNRYTGPHADAFQQGVKAWEALHVLRGEQLVPTAG